MPHFISTIVFPSILAQCQSGSLFVSKVLADPFYLSNIAIIFTIHASSEPSEYAAATKSTPSATPSEYCLRGRMLNGSSSCTLSDNERDGRIFTHMHISQG